MFGYYVLFCYYSGISIRDHLFLIDVNRTEKGHKTKAEVYITRVYTVGVSIMSDALRTLSEAMKYANVSRVGTDPSVSCVETVPPSAESQEQHQQYYLYFGTGSYY